MLKAMPDVQDSSSNSDWPNVGVEPDIARVVSYYEWSVPTSCSVIGVAYEILSASEVAHALPASRNNLALTVSFVEDAAQAAAELEEEFATLASEWKQATAHLSSSSMIATHPSYQKIIGMGQRAIPLILQDLGETKAQWFWALRFITRESPVLPKDRGDVDAMTDAWLGWGRRRRYI